MSNTFIKISDMTEIPLSAINVGSKIEISNPTVSSNSVSMGNVAAFVLTGANLAKANVYNNFSIAQGGPSSNLSITSGFVDWNLDTIQIATITLTSNITANAPTSMRFRTHVMIVNQANGGNYTITWNSVFKWSGGTPPTLSTANNAKDIITLICDGTNMYGVATTNLA